MTITSRHQAVGSGSLPSFTHTYRNPHIHTHTQAQITKQKQPDTQNPYTYTRKCTHIHFVVFIKV